VITESRPTGSQPCETTVRTGTPRSTAPTAPLVEHLAVAEERLGVGLAAARREAADERHGVLLLVQLREEAGRRVRERVDQQRDEVGVVQVRDPGHRDALVGLECDALKVSSTASGSDAGPDGRGRAVLELAVARDHAFGHAAEHVCGRQLLSTASSASSAPAKWSAERKRKGKVDRGAAERRAASRAASPAASAASGETDNPAPTRRVSVSGLMGRSVRLGFGSQLLPAAALPPLRPAAFFCAVVPPCRESPPEPDFLPPRLDAPGELAISPRAPSTCPCPSGPRTASRS
jgi:hypothetical protein